MFTEFFFIFFFGDEQLQCPDDIFTSFKILLTLCEPSIVVIFI